jgi:ATP-dependent DNA helicase RecQ
MRLLRRCVTAGWIDFSGGDRPVAVLTEDGAEVMHARRPARLLLPPEQSAADRKARSTGSEAAAGRAPRASRRRAR